MQLSANKTAQFFIQNEYHQVELDGPRLLLSSVGSEERIPFTIWSGKIAIKRGLFWGSLQFFANQQDGKQRSWLVQGLPWEQCRQFARTSVAAYQKWHDTQCEQLAEHVPQWEAELTRLEQLPAFLAHSKVKTWVDMVNSSLENMTMTLEEAAQRMPNRIARMQPWLSETEIKQAERNQQWLETERQNWEVLFAQCESSPLNLSQQYAVLMNDDHNLILAGAGSGKTSVLTARVAYLLQSHQAQAEELLLLAFGREAAEEMKQRLNSKIGLSAEKVQVSTFHQLGLKILNQVEPERVVISPLALDDNQRQAWCIDWLKKHWMTPTNFKRWQKHLSKWPIAYLTGDDELGSHVSNLKLIGWLEKQLEQLNASGLSKKEVQQQLIDHRDYTRLNSELSLCWPCVTAWQKELKEQNHIDFSIMISRATQYVEKGKFISPWKFIMIDEYQDISPDRLALVEALCNQSKAQHQASIFAVGDDWQSIYQFAGADVDLTTGFKDRFESSTIHHLDTTYRFNNQLGAVANRFVQENPIQIPKELNSFKQQKQKAVYSAPSKEVEKILDQLNRQSKGKANKSVLLLGRNHYHKPELLEDWKKIFTSIDIKFMTCHGSKGKEADFVIILCVDEGQFPTKKKQLHIDGALTESSDAFPYAEERRLFYVAMTRAKEKVWITHSGDGSGFVQELHGSDYPVVRKK
ncbi:DNA helicase IV [Vibrio splendidus]|uniref:DNA helicase IV n=1 Tax=Vibrio TaxID=662 RepID=UPI000C844EC8|nr:MULTISPECIES: DNA helicase IV [Vibrio]MBB1464172.1 DNA helicase IV [Vibrio sp. SG41-7]PMP01319.1 DNA helicase IV [Vibrio splendidus]PMP27372.1 DNA helicase IV [Vibrio splendidus]PMP35927.1 DNA helicase IV [Vibrio splendidus]PMP40865.1 DNA helicase IV [Vibrio splendidus]